MAAELRSRLPKGVEVAAVTGQLPPAEREERVAALAKSPKRVLVCTDCLSEGINLQEHFDAVIHYDLSWNPTRHEQREGRVDRYGQPSKIVRVVTYYGVDNQIDGLVLDVLIRKHKTIRSSLGVSVPVPANTNQVIEAVFEGCSWGKRPPTEHQQLLPFGELRGTQTEPLFTEWEAAADREKRSRTMFAQETIKPDEVLRSCRPCGRRSARASTWPASCATRSARTAASSRETGDGHGRIDLSKVSRAPARAHRCAGQCPRGSIRAAGAEGVAYLNRTHPAVEAAVNPRDG